MNGLTFVALIALAAAVAVAYRIGWMRGERAARKPMPWPSERTVAPVPTPPAPRATHAEPPAAAEAATAIGAVAVPSAPETPSVPRPPAAPPVSQWVELAEDRHRLLAQLADALGETARYRQIVVDIERNAPPPLLDAPGAPDDLKLIVGVGPALERMLYQLGITHYRQIARWSERDIDEIDARLAEFPGRIRRDAWVTQARALHQSKYGERP